MLVSSLTEELHSAQTDRWFDARQGERFFTSDWVATEFSSALSDKLRSFRLTATGQRAVLAAFASMTARSFEVLPVTRDNVRMAARFANRHELGLRGGDALHLALCDGHGISLCTLGERMKAAALALGIRAITPLDVGS